MSGLCGWLAEKGIADPAALLNRMAASLPAAPTAQTASTAGNAHGLAARGDIAETAWHEEAGISAAIIGYPRWKQDTLQAMARTKGHAAALIAAYQRYDRELLDQLAGHFVLAIIEPGRGRALCAIDRFGVYRLCYASPRPGSFVFATSADAVRAYPGVGATISPQTVYQYLYFIDRVAAPGTIYDEQSKLHAGEAVLLDRGKLHRWQYWQLDYRHSSSAAMSDLHQALREKLERSVAASVDGEKPERVSSFLSGGLDSSTVTGYLAKVNAGKGRCVTIGFHHVDFDETPYARIAAKAFGLKHDLFMVGPREVLSVLPELSTYFDEPFSNSSAIPCFYCAKVSREAGMEMMLAGDGGDELFAGNTRYLKDGVFDYYRKIPAVLRRLLLDPLLSTFPWKDRIALLRRAASYSGTARRSVPDRLTCHNAFAFAAAEQIFTPDAFAAIDPEGPRRFAEALYDRVNGEAKVHKMMHFDLQLTLADSDLRKVLTSCTAAGIRVRFPMLDDDLAAFSASVPPQALMDGGRIRQFYKKAMSGFLPQEILEKPKQGFGLPMFHYIAGSAELSDFFCAALSDLKRRHLFTAAFLDRLIEDTRQGHPETHTGLVWDLAVLETWMASRPRPTISELHAAGNARSATANSAT